MTQVRAEEQNSQEHKLRGREMVKKGYKKLIVWQKADKLAYQVYLATRDYPRKDR